MREIIYTIIIPHKNTPELLRRCLNSIPQREDIEIIVVDDNSAQEKLPVISREDVILIQLNPDQSKGAGHARNVALDVAKGRWILFADADDYFVENFLFIIDQYKYKDIDVLYFGYNFIDENQNILNDTIETCKVLSTYKPTRYNVDLVRFNNYAPWSKMVSHKFIEDNAIRFEEVRNGNDILFSLLVASFSMRYDVETSPIYVYVKTDNSLTTQKLSTEAHICRIEHYVKLSKFYRQIGRREWSSSVSRYMLYVLKTEGFKRFISLSCSVVSKLPLLLKGREDFVKLTKSQ